jgi:4-diphosphocytidyl-2-C-methyl-D-erythritol kinase
MAEAQAKLNLCLEIIRRRYVGYHELVSVFQAIALADRLTVRADDSLRLETTSELMAEDNLVLRAARLVEEATEHHRGARFTLEKKIPIAAGLGGGSADGAAALLLLRRLWGEYFPVRNLATQLGSDVPFFLGGPTAFVAGRGELVDPLPSPPPQHVLLLRPRVRVSTARVFSELRPEEWSDGDRTRQVASLLRRRMPIPEHLLVNSLEASALRVCPELHSLWSDLKGMGLQPHLSGSGPTVFMLIRDTQMEERLRTFAERADIEIIATRFWQTSPIQIY